MRRWNVRRREQGRRRDAPAVRRIHRGTRHEALGRSFDCCALPVAATPVVNLSDSSQGRLVHQRKEGVRDPRTVYEQHRIAGAVNRVLEVAAINGGALHAKRVWHCRIMRLFISERRSVPTTSSESCVMANETLRKTMADYHDLVASGRRELYRLES